MNKNKLELSVVELASQTAPVIREVSGTDWYEEIE